MKDNKLYKFLRIVFLTLAIISLIFSLSKKFVHAASSSGPSLVTQFPLPYGPSSGYGAGGSSLYTQEVVDGAVSFFFSNFPNSRPYITLATIYEVADNYIVFSFHNTSNGQYTLPTISFSGGTYPNLSNTTFSVSVPYGANAVKFDGSSYSFVQGSSNINTSVSSWCSTSPTGSLYLDPTKKMWGYPVWIHDGGDIVYNDNVYFTLGSSDGGYDGPGFGSGTITGEVTDYEGHGFDYDLNISIDLNPLEVLGEEIKDNLDTLKDRVVEGFQVIGGKIDTFKDRVLEGFQTLSSIPSKVSDTYDYITEPFDEEKFTDKFEDMELGQEIATFRTDIESFTGSFDVAPAVADDVKFTIPFTLPYVNQNLQAVIDFSFYDSIRSIVVPFFTVFLIFGMVWSLIRSIPGILHGTSPDGDS